MSICSGSVSADFHGAKIHSKDSKFLHLVSPYVQPCKVKQVLLVLGGIIIGLKLGIAS